MWCGTQPYTATVPPRQGIFGGTFDPPHVGHVAAAVSARDQLGIATLCVAVANDPWQKSERRSVTPAHHRFEMTRLAFEAVDGIEVTDIELRRGGPTFTIETVIDLERPGTETVLVVGPEAAAGLGAWNRADELACRVTVGILQPPGHEFGHLDGWKTMPIVMAPVDASATRVRELLAAAAREPARGSHDAVADAMREAARMVPDAVMSYIADRGLYSA